jgi:FAD binding domain
MMSPSLSDFQRLSAELEGVLHFDATTRRLYATDASLYREMPQAVALPKSEEDICKLIRFAHEHGTSLIPRAAGTSLAGQVVGGGHCGGCVAPPDSHFRDRPGAAPGACSTRRRPQ